MKKLSTILLAAVLVMAIMVPASAAEEKDESLKDLKARISSAVDASDVLSKEVKSFVKKNLLDIISNETIVAETAAQNKKKVKLDEIKKIDDEWQEAEDEIAIFDEKTTNKCAKEIGNALKDLPEVVEAFVMDDQGAVVGENALTSDYWQGDEAKWQNSYADGKGGVDAGKVKFDASANMNLQQVSLPIAGEDGKVIGAVTFGLNVDKIK